MALARIITRSQACSRELALDLLARGYAVEIVSPDEIPDNLADLELRVEEDPGNHLVASVATHNGQRSASLDFLHHLKAPMGDFLRRPPEPPEVPQVAVPPVTFKRERGLDDAVSEGLSDSARSPGPVMSVGTGAAPVQGEPKTRQQSAASRITPLERVPPLEQPAPPPLVLPTYFAVEGPTIPRLTEQAATIPPPRRALRRDPAARWRWWTALVFASMAMLVLGFGFGLRRMENSQVSGGAPLEKVEAASPDAILIAPPDSAKDSAPISSAIVSARKQTPIAPAAIAATSRAAVPLSKVSRRRGDDLIAPNTTTYLDKRSDARAFATPTGKSKPVKRVAHRRPSSRKRRHDVVAANKISYLDKPARKASK